MAFVKFYIDQVNRSWMTPDATLLPPLAHPKCMSCAGLQEDAVELAQKHQRMSPAPGKIEKLTILPGTNSDQALVSMEFTQTGAKVYDASGAVVDQDNRIVETFVVALTWEGDRWLVLGIGKD